MKKIQEEKDTETNIIPFDEARLKLANKPPPTTGNWLSTLKKGTRFLAVRRNSPEPICGDFFVGSDPSKMAAVFLGHEVHTDQGAFRFVDPVRFSNMFEFIQTIDVEIPDDGIEVQEGRVESDGGPEERYLHDEE